MEGFISSFQPELPHASIIVRLPKRRVVHLDVFCTKQPEHDPEHDDQACRQHPAVTPPHNLVEAAARAGDDRGRAQVLDGGEEKVPWYTEADGINEHEKEAFVAAEDELERIV